MPMFMVSFFSWWYGRGWKEVIHSLKPRLSGVSTAFSVQLLLPTMFEPWRRITTRSGKALSDRMRAWGDNMFSRAVGFVVRSIVLLAAALTAIVVITLTIVEIVLWPLLPIAIPVCIVLGIIG